ncbi:MAG: CDP-diacylglycerol--glycerol-3-phosphate 3-phosphatidyltransferase [Pseudomonadota bacterium]
MATSSLRGDALSLPNLLTYGRILAVPVIVWAILWRTDSGLWMAFGLFVLAAVTDYFDGWLARKLDQQSALGRMLDPIADKLLVAAVLFGLVAVGTVSGLAIAAALIVLCREILVSGLREFLAGQSVDIPVTWIAKWKTTLQLAAVGALILAPAVDEALPSSMVLALALLWISAAITLYTGYDYVRSGLGHLEGRPRERP